jgi:hypothetical protein
MGQRAVIVIDTDHMSSITDDPENFVLALRHRINNSVHPEALCGPFGIRYAAIQHTTSTMLYEVSPSGVNRKFPDDE